MLLNDFNFRLYIPQMEAVCDNKECKCNTKIIYPYEALYRFGELIIEYKEIHVELCSNYLDKNNMELYENDIIRVTNKDKRLPFNEIARVYCNDKYKFFVDYKNPQLKEVTNTLDYVAFSYFIEKLGNIHENAKLFENV